MWSYSYRTKTSLHWYIDRSILIYSHSVHMIVLTFMLIRDFMILTFIQTVDKLKYLLKRENITYTIDLFYSNTGLASLNRKPFSVINNIVTVPSLLHALLILNLSLYLGS